MRWRLPTFAVVAALAVLLADMPAAFAQTPETPEAEDEDDFHFDRACMDDYGRDLCDRDTWADIVSSFGLDSAELAQRQGLRGVRVFTINGYSNDMPAISILASRFDRSKEPEDAEVEVRRQPFRDESKAGPPFLKRNAWSNIYEKAEDLQDLVAASPERQRDEVEEAVEAAAADPSRDVVVSMCLHAWVTVTESLTDEGVTRRIRNACGSDPVFDSSYDMSGHALRGFPYCAYLDPENHRNESTQIERCFSLQGTDKIAAADVANLFDGSINDTADLGPFLAPDVRLTRADRARVMGAKAVTAALADPAFEDFRLYAGYLVGASDRVVASGWLDKYLDEGVETADIELTLRRRDATWRIAEIVIGPSRIEE